jgi:hypothetical protein
MKKTYFHQVLPFSFDDHEQFDFEDPLNALTLAFSLIKGEALSEVPQLITLRTTNHGAVMDFSCTPTCVPVLSSRAASIVARLCPDDVQFIRTTIDGRDQGFQAANVRKIDCVSDVRQVEVPAPQGGTILSDSYRIDRNRVGKSLLFRLEPEPLNLVMTEPLRVEMERCGLVGPALHPMDFE